MGHDLRVLLQQIRSRLDVRGADPAKPLLTELEHTLTDGYARALELEAERLRLKRRMGELAHTLDGADEAEELRGLSVRLRTTDVELENLRELLALLQRHVDEARATRAAV